MQVVLVGPLDLHRGDLADALADLGELEIVKARKKAEAALGEKFDIRAFHDAVLASGAVPLNILEARMDAWIKSRKPAPAKQ